MSKFTPGKWTAMSSNSVSGIPGATTTVINSNGKMICRVFSTQKEESKANVELIKDAPEMYKKLKLILGLYATGIKPSIGFIKEIDELICKHV